MAWRRDMFEEISHLISPFCWTFNSNFIGFFLGIMSRKENLRIRTHDGY
jgi:hypothetical protein